ncbi:MAG: sensor histidine kinase [Bacillota bacterium]|nr:sensor histidine kinase [Bacillota bacterium]
MKRAVVIVLAAIIVLIYIIIPNIKNSHMVKYMTATDVREGWQYREGDSPTGKDGVPLWLKNNDDSLWKGFEVPGTPPINDFNSEDVWVRVKLPQDKYKDPSIFFTTYDQVFEIFIDGKLLYKFGDFSKSALKKSPGSPWHLVELPDDYGGKYVYIKMHSVRKVNTGLIRRFQINSKSSNIINMIKEDMITFSFAFMFVFIGFITILLSLIKRKEGQVFTYFSLSCISVGIWLIAENGIKQLFFYAPQLWVYIDIASQYSIPIVFTLLINSLLEYRHKLVLITIAKVHAVLLVISFLLDILNITPLVCTLPVFYVVFGISMAVAIIVIAGSYKSWNIETKLFSAGFTVLCCSGVFDIINWSFNPKHSNTYLTQWGIFIFLFTLLFVMIFHYLKAQDKVVIYSEELKFKERVLNESKQQLEFFSNISHELRTPLNIILSTIQLLDLFKSDGTIKIVGRDTDNYFKIMKQNCYRLIRLVNNLIDITKIDSGYLKPRFQNHDIVMVVEDITQSVADYIKSRGIDIIFDTDVEEKTIACDPEIIERIMLNLLSNAVKFSKPGASILVDVHDEEENVLISVKDTGIGIEKDKIDMIFERFVQVDKSFTRNHEGSGIGLSLVKSLVEILGGTITVESEYGKGSMFKILLPTNLKEEDRMEEPEIHAVHVEKVNIEFSDIYS